MQKPPSSRPSVAQRGFCFAAIVFVCLALVSLGAGRARAAIPVVDGCLESDYLDRTAPNSDRDFNWDYAFAGDPERCITIRVGQSVRWIGDFPSHPLDPDEGTTPSPILPIASPDASGQVTFQQVGIYGYRCNFHFSMRGAVQVLPALALPVPWLSQPLALGALALLGALFFAIARRALAAFESNRLPLSLRRFW
jgi:hypothetical protein